MRLLIIEDSRRLRHYLEAGLRRSGYAVDTAGDGAAGYNAARSGSYDVIILDLLLPELPGIDVLHRLRKNGTDSHVLILTAKDAVEDRIAGLQAGADDYLVKPFAFDELVARIQALTRRRHGRKNPHVHIGDLAVDLSARTVSRDGESIALTAREYALLEYLALRRGQVVTRHEIEERLYDGRTEPASNVVDAAVYALRRKIDPPDTAAAGSYIQTRRSLGYVLDEPVRS